MIGFQLPAIRGAGTSHAMFDASFVVTVHTCPATSTDKPEEVDSILLLPVGSKVPVMATLVPVTVIEVTSEVVDV
jgi:hypothetical protein